MTQIDPIKPVLPAPIIIDPTLTPEQQITAVLVANPDPATAAKALAEVLPVYVAQQIAPVAAELATVTATVDAHAADALAAKQALALAIDPNGAAVDLSSVTTAQYQAVQARRLKDETDLANTKYDSLVAANNAALTAARQALKDQATANASAIAQLNSDHAAVLAAKDSAAAVLQGKLDAVNTLAAARKIALSDVMTLVGAVATKVAPLLTGE